MSWRAHEITDEQVAAVISKALSLLVGKGRRYTVDEVAAATGIPLRTLQDYHAGTSIPGGVNLLRLITWFAEDHPEFGLAILRPTGLLESPTEGQILAIKTLRRALPGVAAAVEALTGEESQ